MSEDEITSIRINKVKKRQYKEFGRSHGFNTLSKLIFASLDVIQRNPKLLEPTEDKESVKMLESLESSLSVFDSLSDSMKVIFEKLEQLERFQEFIVKKLGATKTELKELQQKDISGEAVFEE
ncbi:MAG: hypothetical protein ACFE9L_19225 [Candidatus Hodarchaeota archaeon]